MKCISVRESGDIWSVYVQSDAWRGVIWLDLSGGVPVVIDVIPSEPRPVPLPRPPRLPKRRRRWGWSPVGEFMEM